MGMVIRLFVPALTALLLFAASSHAQNREHLAVTGTWLVENGTARVKIEERGGKFYGSIIWLREPLESDGTVKRDKNNPEEKLRSRKILGLEILCDFTYDEDYEWEDGEIYDPKNGKTYSCELTLQADGKTLDVRGYIGISLIGRSQTWTRVSGTE
jgi:uncharacterized protein (DUF2147 family)